MADKNDVHIIDKNDPDLTMSPKEEKIFAAEFTKCYPFETNIRKGDYLTVTRDIRMVTCKKCLALLGEELAEGQERISDWLKDRDQNKKELKTKDVAEIIQAKILLEEKISGMIEAFEQTHHGVVIEGIEIDRMSFTAMTATIFPPKARLSVNWYEYTEKPMRTHRLSIK